MGPAEHLPLSSYSPPVGACSPVCEGRVRVQGWLPTSPEGPFPFPHPQTLGHSPRGSFPSALTTHTHTPPPPSHTSISAHCDSQQGPQIRIGGSVSSNQTELWAHHWLSVWHLQGPTLSSPRSQQRSPLLSHFWSLRGSRVMVGKGSPRLRPRPVGGLWGPHRSPGRAGGRRGPADHSAPSCGPYLRAHPGPWNLLQPS